MTISSKPLAVMIFAILFGGILLANGLGWWETESTKQAAVYTDGEFAGQANPADIRGSYTFGDVENNFDIPASLLAEAFGVTTEDSQSFPVKSLESLFESSAEEGVEIGTASVRLFVAFYKGLPYDLSADIYLPGSAALILEARPLTAVEASYLAEHTVSEAVPTESELVSDNETLEETSEDSAAPTPNPEVHEPLNEYIVKGKTTFREVLEWGVAAETIEAILGKPMPAAKGVLIRDFCTENDLGFETIKTALQAEVDLVVK